MRALVILALLAIPSLASAAPGQGKTEQPGLRCTTNPHDASEIVVYDPACKNPVKPHDTGTRSAPDSPTGADTGAGSPQSGTTGRGSGTTTGPISRPGGD
jgi:hypothetical protein